MHPPLRSSLRRRRALSPHLHRTAAPSRTNPAPAATAPAPAPPLPEFARPRVQPAAAPPRRTSEDWEALIGGNWVNKIGVFVAVIGIALLLNYAWDQMGAAGRVALSLAASFSLLVSGVVFERREKYRTFSYGLIGGGWAALYTTVYAMYAVSAAKVLDNAFAATLLLLAVSAGMIVHSLKYRSQSVTGLAYFLAFVTLAIAEVTTFGVIMLVPLAASLLYVAHRNGWNRFALFGLVATYVTCGLHQDTGLAALADTGPLSGLLAHLRSLRSAACRPLAAAAQRPRLPGAFRRQVDPRRAESDLATGRRGGRALSRRSHGARPRRPLAARRALQRRARRHRHRAQVARSVAAARPPH